MSRDQNAERSHNMKTDNRFFEMVEEIKYLGKTLTSQNSIQEEIKSRWLRECLLSFGAEYFVFQFANQKNLKIKIYRSIILQVVLNVCEIWSLKLREESRLRVFENRVLRRIFGPGGGTW